MTCITMAISSFSHTWFSAVCVAIFAFLNTIELKNRSVESADHTGCPIGILIGVLIPLLILAILAA